MAWSLPAEVLLVPRSLYHLLLTYLDPLGVFVVLLQAEKKQAHIVSSNNPPLIQFSLKLVDSERGDGGVETSKRQGFQVREKPLLSGDPGTERQSYQAGSFREFEEENRSVRTKVAQAHPKHKAESVPFRITVLRGEGNCHGESALRDLFIVCLEVLWS